MLEKVSSGVFCPLYFSSYYFNRAQMSVVLFRRLLFSRHVCDSDGDMTIIVTDRFCVFAPSLVNRHVSRWSWPDNYFHWSFLVSLASTFYSDGDIWQLLSQIVSCVARHCLVLMFYSDGGDMTFTITDRVFCVCSTLAMWKCWFKSKPVQIMFTVIMHELGRR